MPKRHTDETKRRISESLMAKPESERHLKASIAALTGWENTVDRSARARKAQDGLNARFEREIREAHPDMSDADVHKRVKTRYRRHIQTMVRNSIKARQAKREAQDKRAAELTGQAGRRGGMTVYLTSKADIFAAARDETTFTTHRTFKHCRWPMIPIAFDGDQHTRYRRILAPLFAPAALPTDELRRQAVQLVSSIAPQHGCEAMADICMPYAARGLLTVLGLPPVMRQRCWAWSTPTTRTAREPNPRCSPT